MYLLEYLMQVKRTKSGNRNLLPLLEELFLLPYSRDTFYKMDKNFPYKHFINQILHLPHLQQDQYFVESHHCGFYHL